ncbi:hypothetical protein JTB14_023073 [Gonioctena quinquepunctata]|nr:hypothetical protein JTB14_023073 [Gonioctena quinquepunctata]
MDTSDKQDKLHLINNVTENRYENTDFGPYRIYIESVDKNIGYLSNLAVGKIFHKNTQYNPSDIERRGKNRSMITFKKIQEANKLLEDNHFLSSNKFRASIPNNFITSKAILKDIDISLLEEEILDNLKTLNNKKILHVRRLKKNN